LLIQYKCPSLEGILTGSKSGQKRKKKNQEPIDKVVSLIGTLFAESVKLIHGNSLLAGQAGDIGSLLIVTPQ
jgi:hypothetical protein